MKDSIPSQVIKNRRLCFSLGKNDFKNKFAGSYLGIFWAFVQPIITILVYWFVFAKALKRWDTGYEGWHYGALCALPYSRHGSVVLLFRGSDDRHKCTD